MLASKHGRARKRQQRGAALIVALIALVALLGIGGVTLLAVRTDLASAGGDRFETLARYAAESGAAAAVDYLRNNCDPVTKFSALVEPNNVNPQSPAGIMGNGAPPGSAGNPFDPELLTSYEVFLLNNREDSGLAAGNDLDTQLVLRVIGHGPNQTQVTLEIAVSEAAPPACSAAPLRILTWRQIY